MKKLLFALISVVSVSFAAPTFAEEAGAGEAKTDGAKKEKKAKKPPVLKGKNKPDKRQTALFTDS